MSKLKEENVSCQMITVPTAAKILGWTPDRLRYLMREKKVDLGIVIPPKKKGGKYEYKISRPKLDKFLGLSE